MSTPSSSLVPFQVPPPLALYDDNDDIYRGDPPPQPRSPSPDSTSSSSSSSRTGGPLGAITAVVELAITRWARANSSSSSSSSSSRSSIITVSRSQIRRRRRRASTGNLHGVQSERDITARIKAREESRVVPREFSLYLPPLPGHETPPLVRTASTVRENGQAHTRKIAKSSSLQPVLVQLDATLKKSAKARRNQDRTRSPRAPAEPPHAPDPSFPHNAYMLPNDIRAPSRPASFTDLRALHRTRKGKQRDTFGTPPSIEIQKAPKAWWLDVSSPTWEDMRAIGKLLHLHPLTLEDILQQDPREKLELFSRLGYYFIVFRAIESQTTRERFQRRGEHDGNPGGLVGEANVYLVVFREGICTFHFTDISEHTDRVSNRILLLEEIINMSSDWIAHGILDSVVDSFFPFLEEIEREVIDIEDLVFSVDNTKNTSVNVQPQLEWAVDVLPGQSHVKLDERRRDDEKGDAMSIDKYDKDFAAVPGQIRARSSLPCPTVSMFFRRFKRMVHAAAATLSTVGAHVNPPTVNTATLRRMARTRRLVTSLTRLLGTKSEVVTQIRKRLLTASTNISGSGSGNGKGDDVEVAIYMGDVQDHILTLQHSLNHYERMLSQSHPTYLAQLRISVAATKSGTDKAIMILSIVSITVMCIQTLIGLFSLNVHVPTNRRKDGEPGGPYYLFGVVIALAIMILVIFVRVVRWWWVQAKRKRRSGTVL